jgi:hypothetical protein
MRAEGFEPPRAEAHQDPDGGDLGALGAQSGGPSLTCAEVPVWERRFVEVLALKAPR